MDDIKWMWQNDDINFLKGLFQRYCYLKVFIKIMNFDFFIKNNYINHSRAKPLTS